MTLNSILPVILLAALLAGCGGSGAVEQKVTLNIVTAGDVNMEVLQRDGLGPEFVKNNPGLAINVVGTGPGDAGSAAIYTRLKEQLDAGSAAWDIDVAIVHQSIMGQMISDGLLLKYVPGLATAKYLVAADARNSLGVNVEGYVMPMFHSQTALAYNPQQVPVPPNDYAELVEWIEAHPQRFGYNGVKGGMSGVAFVGGYLYWRSRQYDQLVNGPYEQAIEQDWDDYFRQLKALPALLTSSNNDTLDKLDSGEIDMGPVWVDMLIQWKNEGRMNPDIRLKLIEPGMPGQPLYLVIPAKAAHVAEAKKYIEFVSTPEVQARVVVEQQGWYPGIDPIKVLPNVSAEGKARLFGDISPDTLNRLGILFPIAPYMQDFISVYEQAQ